MPELPEAETIARGLRPRVVGRTLARVEVVHGDVLRVSPRTFRGALTGVRIEEVGRRGKNVVLRLSGGGADVLVVNLGMTGRLLPFPPGRPASASGATHPALRFRFHDGGGFVFDDVRRFGAVEALDGEAWAERSAALGPEPLGDGFTPEGLHGALSRSRSPIRSWLLDQRRIAGVGNIYAAEALFRAGVHPRRPASSLDEDEAARLHGAVREVLAAALGEGGTTIRDYRNAEGGRGAFVHRLAVYGREGEPCRQCNGPVERLVFGNRSAFLCPRCQPGNGESP